MEAMSEAVDRAAVVDPSAKPSLPEANAETHTPSDVEDPIIDSKYVAGADDYADPVPETAVDETERAEKKRERRERKEKRRTRKEKGKEREDESIADQSASIPDIDTAGPPGPFIATPAAEPIELAEHGVRKRRGALQDPLPMSAPFHPRRQASSAYLPDPAGWTIHVDPNAKRYLRLLIGVLVVCSLILWGSIHLMLNFNEFHPESREELPVLLTLNVANVPKFHEKILEKLRPRSAIWSRPGEPDDGRAEVGSMAMGQLGCVSRDEDGNCDDWSYPMEEEDSAVAPTKPAGASAMGSVYESVNLNITTLPWHTAPITGEFTLLVQYVPGDGATEPKFKNRRVSVDTLHGIMETQFAPVTAHRRRQLFIKNNRLSKAEQSAMDSNLDKDIIAYNARIKREKKEALSKLDGLSPFERNLARDELANRQAQKEREGAAQGNRCICSEMVGSVSRFAFSCLSDEELASTHEDTAQCRMFLDPELEPSWDLVTIDSFRRGCFHQDPEWQATLESLARVLKIESQPDGGCPLALGRNSHTRISYTDAPEPEEMFWFYGPKAYTPLHLELHMHNEKVAYETGRSDASALVRASKWMLNYFTKGQRAARVRLQDRIAYRYDLIQARERQMKEALANSSLLQDMAREKSRAQDRMGAPAAMGADGTLGLLDATGLAVADYALRTSEGNRVGHKKVSGLCLKDMGKEKRLALDSFNQTTFFTETEECIRKDFSLPALKRKTEIVSGSHSACIAQCYRMSKVIAAEVLEVSETNAAARKEIQALLDELRGRNALRAMYSPPGAKGGKGAR